MIYCEYGEVVKSPFSDPAFCRIFLGGTGMTIIDGIISRFTQLSSWLISRQWEREEILIIAIVALFLLLLVLRARRKAKISTTRYIPHYTPTTTIGIKLAHRGARH
jgi:hypothetical protein